MAFVKNKKTKPEKKNAVSIRPKKDNANNGSKPTPKKLKTKKTLDDGKNIKNGKAKNKIKPKKKTKPKGITRSNSEKNMEVFLNPGGPWTRQELNEAMFYAMKRKLGVFAIIEDSPPYDYDSSPSWANLSIV